MYKIIRNDSVIDVIQELQYVRYINDFFGIKGTDNSSAQAFLGSKGQFYRLDYMEYCDYIPALLVEILPINEQEYDNLKLTLDVGGEIQATEEVKIETTEDRVDELEKLVKLLIEKNAILESALKEKEGR